MFTLGYSSVGAKWRREQSCDPFGGLAEPEGLGLFLGKTIQDVGDEPVWALKVYGPSILRNCPEQLLCLGGVCSPQVKDGHIGF